MPMFFVSAQGCIQGVFAPPLAENLFLLWLLGILLNYIASHWNHLISSQAFKGDSISSWIIHDQLSKLFTITLIEVA